MKPSYCCFHFPYVILTNGVMSLHKISSVARYDVPNVRGVVRHVRVDPGGVEFVLAVAGPGDDADHGPVAGGTLKSSCAG